MAYRPRSAVVFVLLAVLSFLLLRYAMGPKDGGAFFPGSKYPSGVPAKFDPNGRVQPFAGNTVISHLPSSDPLYKSLMALYKKLEKSHLKHLYALLPPTSWHMTVFEGVCDTVRKPGRWPDDLPINATLEECTGSFEKKLTWFDLQDEPPYQMSVLGFNPLTSGIEIHLKPQTTEEELRMRGLRDRLSQTLRIRAHNHDTYGFHLSLAYLLRVLTEEQNAELITLLAEHYKEMPQTLELGAPEFCTFDNMYGYNRIFYLKSWPSPPKTEESGTGTDEVVEESTAAATEAAEESAAAVEEASAEAEAAAVEAEEEAKAAAIEAEEEKAAAAVAVAAVADTLDV